MEQIIEWIKSVDFIGIAAAVLSSGAISAIITGCFTCLAERRKAKAKIQQIELEKQKEMELIHAKWENERNENRRHAYACMISSVTNYKSMHDITHKCDAETAITLYIPYAGEEERSSVDELLNAVSESEPFAGPDQNALKAITKRICGFQ